MAELNRISIDVDRVLYGSAESQGAITGRNATQQLEHWARVGRALERSRNYLQQAVDDVLAGRRRDDTLTELEGIALRVLWTARFEALADGVDLRPFLRAQGHRYAYGADDQGRVVRYDLSEDAHDVSGHGEPREDDHEDGGVDA